MALRNFTLTSLFVGLFLMSGSLFSQTKLELFKLPNTKLKKIVRHPVEEYFGGVNDKIDFNERGANKLLVMLVDFELEEIDDPTTTGNGKFLTSQEDIDNYPISLGKPPHDQEFYDIQLQAMRYYYQAASFNSFNLEYDIYPLQNANTYTLPQKMSYYNPVGASNELMISRFEEYFKDIFETVDKDPDVRFSDYKHFMVIHAGADFQHDRNGDTPSDIPSFFMKVYDDQKVVVDDGETTISYMCNVPETIVQDTTIDESGEYAQGYGYGVVNGSFAHEFGHSLGLPDLYGTTTNYPGVGYFDLMDSGGMVQLGLGFDETGMPATSNSLHSIYNIEGALVALFGGWSRVFLWEDYFRSKGILKDISEFNLNDSIEVIASDVPFPAFGLQENQAYFIKIPLNEKEYIIIENRQTDPDADGFTGAQTDLESSRVVLYPIDINDQRTYQYDYILPGWLDKNGYAVGGGLLMWHADSKIMFDEGITDDEGHFQSNFAANRINIFHSRRAVRILEADGFDDIGNVYSRFWYGTAFEYFFKKKPVIDTLGYFSHWSDEIAVDNIDSETIPALISNEGEPSLYKIFDIDSIHYDDYKKSARIVSFRIGSKIFDHTEKIEAVSLDSIVAFGNINEEMEFPIFGADSLEIIYKDDSEWKNLLNSALPVDINPTYNPILVDYDNDGDQEYIVVDENKVFSVTTIGGDFPENIFDSDSTIIEQPLAVIKDDITYLTISTSEKLILYTLNQTHFFDEIKSAKCIFDGENLIAISKNFFYEISLEHGNPTILRRIDLGFNSGAYVPIALNSNDDANLKEVFLQNHKGNVYSIKDDSVREIFSIEDYGLTNTSQLALGKLLDDGRIYLVFGAEDKIFTITINGTLANGFPVYAENRCIKNLSFPRIIELNNETIIFIEDESQGYLAVNESGEICTEYSFFWNKTTIADNFYWNENEERLYHFYLDNIGIYENTENLLLNKTNNLYVSYSDDVIDNPIIWNGYRNQGQSVYYGSENSTLSADKFTAFAYPNPAKEGYTRIRVEGMEKNIEVRIFDIAANLIFKQNYKLELGKYQDNIVVNTSKMASGVYYAVVKSGDNTKKVPIVIEN